MFNFFRNKWVQSKVIFYTGDKIASLIRKLVAHNAEDTGVDRTYEDAYIRVRYQSLQGRSISSPDYKYEVWVKTNDGETVVFNRLRDNYFNKTNVNTFRKGAWILHIKKLVKDDISDINVFDEKREGVRFNGNTKEKKLKFLEKKNPVTPKNKTSRLDSLE